MAPKKVKTSVRCPKCRSENPQTSLFCAACGTELSPAEDKKTIPTRTIETPLEELRTGSTFASRYQIIEELGRGGMGRVYRALDQKLDEEVALKLIRPEIALDKKTLERFHNELKLARKISHRNIGRMYELLEDRGRHFITMEYVPGQDLRGLIRQTGQLTPAKAVSIAQQVCQGLAEAHRLGIIHRDLKPSNIIIDRDGNARIMDFGIARSLSGKGITGEGVTIGTPEYMSPEQVEGKETDQRSDVYSLGIILYEMATGRVPFEGDTPFTVGVKHKSEVPKNPRELNPQISEELSRLILRCLEKDKDRRYQSAEDVRQALERVEKGAPATPVMPRKKALTSREITVKFDVRRTVLPALGILALAAVVLVVWRVLPRRQAPAPLPSEKPSLAILYFENISGDKSLDAWKTGLTELLITKLSQSKFIRVLDANTIYGILRRFNLAEARKYTNEDLVKVANEGRADYTLNGSLMKAGERIIINLTLQKPQTGEVISPINVECQGEAEIISRVDAAADRIKSDLNLTSEQIAVDLNKEAGKITTSSAEAFKYYSEARIHHLSLEPNNAIPLYEKAVALDPAFAMAYRGLAAAYRNLGSFSKGREYIQRAFELKDRASAREASIIEGQYYWFLGEKTYDKAIQVLDELQQMYPDDSFANGYLSLIYSSLEEWDSFRKHSEKDWQIRKDLLSHYNLAESYQALGLYDKAQQVFEDYRTNVADNAQVHLYLGWNYLCQGNYDLALREADRAFLLSPHFPRVTGLKGDIFYLTGKWPEAEEEYLRNLERGDKRVQWFARERLAWLSVAQGKFKKAKEHCDLEMGLAEELGEKALKGTALSYSAYIDRLSGNKKRALDTASLAAQLAKSEELPELRSFLCWQGMAYLETGAPAQARQVAGELKESIQDGLNKKAWRYYHLLDGMIELNQKNFPPAVEKIGQAVPLLAYQFETPGEQAIFFGALAQAHYEAGELEKAREEYKKITSLSAGRMAHGDIYAKSFYLLGKIAERHGDRAEATENYRKFLELWKDADHGQPEVDDARKRLANLK